MQLSGAANALAWTWFLLSGAPHVEERLQALAEKYFSRSISAHVTFGHGPQNSFSCDIVAHVMQGVILKGAGQGNEAHPAFDQAADRIETQLRRYMRRLKSRHAGPAAGEIEAGLLVLPVEESGLRITPLFRDEVLYASTRRSPRGGGVTLQEVARAKLVLYDEIADALRRAMTLGGVTFHWNTTVAGCDTSRPGDLQLTLSNGATLAASAVLVCSGRSSRTAALGLDAAGITPGRRGIVDVDGRYRTSVPHIYAAVKVVFS